MLYLHTRSLSLTPTLTSSLSVRNSHRFIFSGLVYGFYYKPIAQPSAFFVAWNQEKEIYRVKTDFANNRNVLHVTRNTLFCVRLFSYEFLEWSQKLNYGLLTIYQCNASTHNTRIAFYCNNHQHKFFLWMREIYI